METLKLSFDVGIYRGLIDNVQLAFDEVEKQVDELERRVSELEDENSKLVAACSASDDKMKWTEIDGYEGVYPEEFLVWTTGWPFPCMASIDDVGYFYDPGTGWQLQPQPTHWMQLPKTPDEIG